MDYFNFLRSRKKHRGEGRLTPRTINDNLSSLRIFSLRLQDEGIIKHGFPIAANLKIDFEHKNDFTFVRNVVSVPEIQKMMKACISPNEKAMLASS